MAYPNNNKDEKTNNNNNNRRLYNPYQDLNLPTRTLYNLPTSPEFLFEEEALAQRRSWGENLTYYTGLSYLSGSVAGAGKGLFDSVRAIEKGESVKLKVNRVLNGSGHTGMKFGNRVGVIGLMYAGLESGMVALRDTDDILNSYSKENLDKNALLVSNNPEYMTAWNYRKLAVEHMLNDPERKEEIDAVLKEELKVAESALRKKPKFYGAWYHRKWVLIKNNSFIDKELELLDKLLSLDSRNFHAWNHRRFVTGLKKKTDEDELKFTDKVIGANFSNYSAWHNRSVLLSQLFENKTEGFFPKENKLEEEYEFVHGAIFTDLDDQSGWFYHLWFLNETVKSNSPHRCDLQDSEGDGLESRSREMISWNDQNFRKCEKYHIHFGMIKIEDKSFSKF